MAAILRALAEHDSARRHARDTRERLDALIRSFTSRATPAASVPPAAGITPTPPVAATAPPGVAAGRPSVRRSALFARGG
jgi:hypothetical protein